METGTMGGGAPGPAGSVLTRQLVRSGAAAIRRNDDGNTEGSGAGTYRTYALHVKETHTRFSLRLRSNTE